MTTYSEGTSGVNIGRLGLFGRVCVKNSEYDFVHGHHGGDYVDVDEMFGTSWYEAVEAEPQPNLPLERLIEKLSQLRTDKRISAVVFIERDAGPIGMIAASQLISKECRLPALTVRPRKRVSRFAIKGGLLKRGEKVALINDVATTGWSFSDAAEVLWRLGVKVEVAIPLVDRNMGAAEFLSRLDIPMEPVESIPNPAHSPHLDSPIVAGK